MAWAGLALAYGWRAFRVIPDDMYITFRYAWNLAHGEGFVFNPGERVFGLSNPGHGLVLGVLHGLTRIPVHVLAAVVFGLALWFLLALLWRECLARGRAWEIAIGGTLVVGASYLWVASGSASSSVLAFLVAAALLFQRHPVAGGILAGLAVWYRPDAVLGVAALGALGWMEQRRFPLRWALAAGVSIAVGLLAAWLWFGAFLPGTLEAKRVMAEARVQPWAGSVRFWARAAQFMPRHFGAGWILLASMGLAGQWPLFANGGLAIRTLVLYGAGVAIAYPLLGVPFYLWYTVPSVTVILLGVGALTVGIGRSLAGAWAPSGSVRSAALGSSGRVSAAAVAVAAILGLPLWSYAKTSCDRFIQMQGGSRYDTFREAGLWIREHSLPEERIAYGEIGQLSYWSRRPLDDLMGLVTPEVLPYVAAGDDLGAFLLRPPDFFLDHPANPNPGIMALPRLDEFYYPVARIENPLKRGEPAIVYRKRPGAELPPPRPPSLLPRRAHAPGRLRGAG